MKAIKKIATIGMIGVLALGTVACTAPEAPNCPVADVQECIQNLDQADVDNAYDAGAASVKVPACVQDITEVNLAEALAEARADSEAKVEILLDEVMDNDGSVEYLTDDLDEEDKVEILDRIIFVRDIKDYAVQAIEADGIDEIDRESVTLSDNTSVTIDEDDVERFKIYDDADEITVDVSDYEDKDAYVYVNAKFEQDEVKYDVKYKVKIYDNAVDRVSVETITERV